MKKILHILVLPKMAGSQKISLEILKSLENDQYKKYVLFGATDNVRETEACFNKFREANAEIIQCNDLLRAIGGRDIRAFLFIYRLCRKEKFDVVHTNSTKPGIIGRIAATIAGVPHIVHTVHGLSFHKFVNIPVWLFYFICEIFASFFCTKIILVNKYYSKYFRLFRKKTTTIYNSIDFQGYPALINRKPFSENVKLLFVGRLDIQKDPLTLLAAMDIIINSWGIKNCVLSIIGDGELYQVCENYIIDHQLTENVKLKGWQSDIAPFYLSHDIFCCSSIFEAFGLIFLEAGFFGLPSVTTDVEGIPEVIIDGETGLLVPCRQPMLMAKRIVELIDDPELTLRLGIKAKERVGNNFSIDKMVEGYKQIYSV
jgi:glycosyltransferase involved in cell wall biosynthesis